MYLVFATMAYFGCLRVGDLRERNGLDTTYHGDSETPTIPITRQLATATLLERLQRLQTATKSIDKAHLVALGVDCGADLDYLISRFEVYSGGLLIISGSDMKV